MRARRGAETDGKLGARVSLELGMGARLGNGL